MSAGVVITERRDIIQNLYLFSLSAVIVVAMIWDITSRRIPNLLILAGFIVGDVIAAFDGGIAGMLLFLLYAILGMAILFIFFFCRILGGGDVKLYGIIAGYLGMRGFFVVLCGSFVAGAVISLFKLIVNRNMRERLIYFASYVERCYKTRRIAPYYNNNEDVKRAWTISFTVPIFIGYVGYLAFVYFK